jgi:hypothetical protein
VIACARSGADCQGFERWQEAFFLAALVPECAGVMLNGGVSELSCARVELGHWLINKCEARRSFDMVARRQQAWPFVLSTNLRLQETADHL